MNAGTRSQTSKTRLTRGRESEPIGRTMAAYNGGAVV